MKIMTAVAYARFSSDKQQESSIAVQLSAIRRFCASHNIQLIHEYVDEAQTGTNSNRKSFQQMVKDAPLREFNLIIVHRMDRWARNVDDSRYYKKYFGKYGIKIISAIEEFDESPEGEFFELMSMGMAELYSKKLSRESIAGKLTNARECKAHGGVPVLGYKVKDKRYVIDEKEAETVRLIFDMVIEGYGYTRIRDYLNANGYRRRDGRLFTIHLTDILRNRKYIGEYVYNRSAYRARGKSYNNHQSRAESEIIRIPNGIPRIIDDYTFMKVQEIMDRRKKKPSEARTKKRYLLTGVIRCNSCGKTFSGGKTINHGIPYYVYRCGSHGKECLSRAINVTYMDEYITSLIGGCLLYPDNRERLIELVKVSYIKANDKLNEELSRFETELKETVETLEDRKQETGRQQNKQLQSYLADEISELTLRKDDLQRNIYDTRQKIKDFPEFKPKDIRKRAQLLYDLLESDNLEDRQYVVNKFIAVIEVDNDTIETTIDLQSLTTTYIPIQTTVIEKRDNVARAENFYRRSLSFPTLHIQVR